MQNLINTVITQLDYVDLEAEKIVLLETEISKHQEQLKAVNAKIVETKNDRTIPADKGRKS